MWWQIVFWVLLVPLVVAEFIIFLKTRKLSWLVYSLSIFTYVIAVSYMIDVFSLDRNPTLLILLASAGVMVLVGRHLAKGAGEQLKRSQMTLIYCLIAVMLLLSIISIAAGKLDDKTTTVASVSAKDIVNAYNDQGIVIGSMNSNPVTLLKRTATNTFFLPVPLAQRNYYACLVTSQGTYDLSEAVYSSAGDYPEINPGETKTFDVQFQRYSDYRVKGSIPSDPSEVLIYEGSTDSKNRYTPCSARAETPTYRISVTA